MNEQAVAQRLSVRRVSEFASNETLSQFSKLFARYELYKLIIDLPGDIVEGGVFQGGGLLSWARLVQIFNPLSKRRVVGFDTFEGFPHIVRHEHDRRSATLVNEQNRDRWQLPAEEVVRIAKLLEVEHRVELVQGDATSTIEDYVRANPGFRVALVNLDFDMYEPTAAALKHLFPLLVPGGVIAFDEYAVRGWGESDAVDEFFRNQNVRFRAFPWASSPKAFMVKD